jgi:DNA polymerase I-like protein with 3'-5' exonuclease and polymerase domains
MRLDTHSSRQRQQSLFSTLELVPVPSTDWSPPSEFPRLDGAPMIAIDTETKDPNLTTHGPGWARGDSHIVGVSCTVPGRRPFYLPMRHEIGGGNLPADTVLRWCARELCREGQPKVGANILYDIGNLLAEGVEVKGPFIDVLYAEALLDEHRYKYDLDSIAEKYLGEGKTTNALYDWIANAYRNKSNPRKDIYRSPAALVGPYAESDADLPLRIWEKQRPLLEEQGLLDLFELECALIPILVASQKRGVPIDETRFEPVIDEMHANKKAAEKAIRKLVGFTVNPDVTDDLVRAFDKLGIAYRKTEKGNPSFTKDFLSNHPHEIARHISEIRRWEKALQYVEGYRDKFAVNGRIHASYHPLRGESGGTIVGRFSASNPNLTNVSKRDPEMKRLIRGLFLPFPGERWRSRDFSQIQFRIMVHYAMGTGADDARQRYIDNPRTDYHDMALDMVAPVAGWDVGTPEKHKARRGDVKNVNFALAFTGGLPTLMKQLGKPKSEVEELLNQYHGALPFLKHTSGRIETVAEERGWIKGILGRRHRFPFWEPKCWALRDFVKKSMNPEEVSEQVARLIAKPPPFLRGKRLFAGVKRANTHLGMNRLAQDGEGSHIKKAMVECHRAGIYDVTGFPMGTVHDDVFFSDPGTAETEEAFTEMKHIMETCVSWKVPMLVEDEVGPNWGYIKPI